MPLDAMSLYLKLPVFFMIAARLGGMLLFQPILGAQTVPTHLRLLLAFGLAALISPFVAPPLEAPTTVGGFVLALGGELLLGILIGLMLAIAFVGIQVGGTLIAQESGLAFGQLVDPTTDESLSVLSSFYVQLAAVVYLIVGGHRALVAACLDSFITLPLLGSSSVTNGGAALLLAALATGFNVALRVAAPVVLTLFLVNLALGFITRTVPQLNIATLGFSLKALIGFAITAVALPTAIAAFTDGLGLTFDYLDQFLNP